MRFLAPLYLLGLLGLCIPVLIHLLSRRRPRRVRFAAVELILRSQTRRARRFRIRQLLLLVARCSVIAALVLALARPQWLSRVRSLGGSGPATATVVVLDDSLSMRLVQGGKTLFEEAVVLAQDVVEGQRPQDSGALLLAGAPVRAPVSKLVFAKDPLLEALAALEPSYRLTDLAGAMARAAQMLASSTLPSKRIVVISDLRAAGFEPARLPFDGNVQDHPELLLLQVGPARAVNNHAVVELEIEPDPAQGPLAYRLRAEVLSTGDGDGDGDGAGAGSEISGREATRELRLHLEIDGELVSSVTLAPKEGRSSKELLYRFLAPGLHRGAVYLDADDLPADDRRDFAIEVQPQVRVLVVNGDPRPTPHMDELFYLERALGPGAQGFSRVRATIIGVPLLAGMDLGSFQVLMLCNVSGLSTEQVGRIEAFVRSGGGLLLTAGDNIAPDRYNREMAVLLPGRLRGLGHGGDQASGQGELLGPMPADSPLIEPFLGPGGEGIRSARFFTYLLLEPGGHGDLQVHLSYASGPPMLVEKELGPGRLALLTTTVDRAWTDLPIRTGFLPLIQELCLHLARASQVGQHPAQKVGTRLSFSLPPRAHRVLLLGPEGPPRRLARPEQLDQGAELSMAGPERPGAYRLRVQDEEGEPIDEQVRVVVSDPAESDLSPLGARLVASLRGGGPNQSDGSGERGGRKASKLWPWALLLLVGMLLAEALLLARRDQLAPLDEILPRDKP